MRNRRSRRLKNHKSRRREISEKRNLIAARCSLSASRFARQLLICYRTLQRQSLPSRP